MPLVQHNNLPSIERVRLEGVQVLAANDIDISLPRINIGFLNMMPDAALAATERQFLRLVGANQAVNCFIYPFNIQGVERSQQAQEYIDKYYINYSSIKELRIDALIITGANVSQPQLQNELFWPHLTEVLSWGKNNCRSMLCSCLATHAAVKVFYDVDRQHLGKKCWGVFQHHLLNHGNRLLHAVNKQIDMCHSRFNDIPEQSFINNGIDVLIKSNHSGVQLAAEPDMSIVYFQGHPEYDDISLLKEYKREVIRYLSGDVIDYPPVPANYFNQLAMRFISEYKVKIEQMQEEQNNNHTHGDTKEAYLQTALEGFPEQDLSRQINDPWRNAAAKVFSNWVDILAD